MADRPSKPTTPLHAEIDALESADAARALLVAAADLAARATAAPDHGVAVRAKARETQVARMIGAHQHAVVACAELVEAFPPALDRGEADPAWDKTKQRLVWGLKFGAGSAMDLPEIPLATVRELLGALSTVLARLGVEPIAVWELEARLAFIEGDADTLADRVARITPKLGIQSHVYAHADCPGCTLLQIATWLGPDAPAEAVEEALAPVLQKRPFPNDASMQRLFSLLYGDDPICDHARRATPIRLARAYARGGRLAEAHARAREALALSDGSEHEAKLRAQVAALEVALGTKDVTEAEARAAEVAPAIEKLEDPYDALDALVVLHRALAFLGRSTELDAVRRRALELAERIDARLAKKRHVAATKRSLSL